MTGRKVLGIIYWIVRLLIRPRLSGLIAVRRFGAAVCVANHSGAFGPIMVMSCLPFRVHPWVTWEITERKTCATYLKEDFTGGEMGLKEPLSRFLAELISPICVLLMKMVGAVPVYRNSRRIVCTMEMSRRLLAAGEKLVIFPEKPGDKPSRDAPGFVGELDTGFIALAKSHYVDRAEELPIFPVAVNREDRSLIAGPPLFLDLERPIAAEKQRIKLQLKKSLTGLCRDGDRG